MKARIALFDLGHVIVDWQPIRLYREYFPTEAEAQAFCDDVCNMAWHLQHDRGVTMADNSASLIAQYPQYETEIHAWRSRWLDMFVGYVPGVPQIIARLEERKIPLYGLSNLPAEVAQETFDAFPVIHTLRDVIVSGAERITKPDPRIYQIALDRMGNPDPGEVIFIDDRLDNIKAAQALGFHTCHFDNAAGLERALIEQALL